MDARFERDIGAWEYPLQLVVHTGDIHLEHHWHDDIEVIQALDDGVLVSVGDARYRLLRGQVALVAGGVTHGFLPHPAGVRRMVFKFHLSLVSTPSGTAAACFAPVPPHSAAWPAALRAEVQEILIALRRQAAQAGAGYQHRVAALLHGLCAAFALHYPQSCAGQSLAAQQPIKQVLAHVADHYTAPLTLQGCAAALGYHPDHLSRLFRRYTGAKFGEYVTALRLARAASLLAQTDWPVARIAAESGFASPKTFYRQFRARYGHAPGALRTLQK